MINFFSKQKTKLIFICFIVLFIYLLASNAIILHGNYLNSGLGWLNDGLSNPEEKSVNSESIQYIQQGPGVYVTIIDLNSEDIYFKVTTNVEKSQNSDNYEYNPSNFGQLLNLAKEEDENLFVAINTSFIHKEGYPMGYIKSNGIDLSFGDHIWIESQYSLAISETNQAFIIKGREDRSEFHHNVTGGFGKFIEEGEFQNLCEGASKYNDKSKLGNFACNSLKARSVVSLTENNYLILYVSSESAERTLSNVYSDLEAITLEKDLGNLSEGLLFDGGYSPGMYVNGVENLPATDYNIGAILGVYYEKPE